MAEFRSFLNDLLALSHVPRWTIVRHHGQQSVADHSFRVAAIAYELWWRLRPMEVDPGTMIIWALWHDVDESVTGDLPSIAKDRLNVVQKKFVEFPPYTVGAFREADREIVKMADYIETYTWLVMNANGFHAGQVKVDMLAQIRAKYSGQALQVIEDICDELIRERGRFRNHATFGQPVP